LWKSLLQVKETYLAGREVVLNNGDLVCFVKEPWTDDPPWCDYFRALFDICQMQDCTIRSFVENDNNLPFRRCLHGFLLEQWNHILLVFGQLRLSDTLIVLCGD
jgi:hypothetical protein